MPELMNLNGMQLIGRAEYIFSNLLLVQAIQLKKQFLLNKVRSLFCIMFFLSNLIGQQRTLNRVQIASDEYDKYTSVGNLGLTITNFGIIGNGWNLMEDGSIHPSCQYKQQTEIAREQVEHFSYAGLWVGGIVNGERRVSTSIVDLITLSSE